MSLWKYPLQLCDFCLKWRGFPVIPVSHEALQCTIPCEWMDQEHYRNRTSTEVECDICMLDTQRRSPSIPPWCSLQHLTPTNTTQNPTSLLNALLAMWVKRKKEGWYIYTIGCLYDLEQCDKEDNRLIFFQADVGARIKTKKREYGCEWSWPHKNNVKILLAGSVLAWLPWSQHPQCSELDFEMKKWK